MLPNRTWTSPAIWIQKLFARETFNRLVGTVKLIFERAKISVQVEQSSRKVLLLNEVRVYWFIRGKRKGSCRGTCPIIRAVRLSGRLATVSFRFPSFWTRNRDGILTSCDVVRVAAFPHGEDVQRLMKVMSFPLTYVPG